MISIKNYITYNIYYIYNIRGLFQSGTGKLINADVNAALNILRKHAPDLSIDNRVSDRHWFMPIKLSIGSLETMKFNKCFC